jgi:hypothetical protein
VRMGEGEVRIERDSILKLCNGVFEFSALTV